MRINSSKWRQVCATADFLFVAPKREAGSAACGVATPKKSTSLQHHASPLENGGWVVPLREELQTKCYSHCGSISGW